MEGRDDEMICPLNNAHIIRRFKFLNHISKCRVQYPLIQLVACKYDCTHVMAAEDLEEHLKHCFAKIFHGAQAKQAFEYIQVNGNCGLNSRPEHSTYVEQDASNLNIDQSLKENQVPINVKVLDWLKQQNTICRSDVTPPANAFQQLDVDVGWDNSCDVVNSVYDDFERMRLNGMSEERKHKGARGPVSLEEFTHQYLLAQKSKKMNSSVDELSLMSSSCVNSEIPASIKSVNPITYLKRNSSGGNVKQVEDDYLSLISSSYGNSEIPAGIKSINPIKYLKNKSNIKAGSLNETESSALSFVSAPSVCSKVCGGNLSKYLKNSNNVEVKNASMEDNACDQSLCRKSVGNPIERLKRKQTSKTVVENNAVGNLDDGASCAGSASADSLLSRVVENPITNLKSHSRNSESSVNSDVATSSSAVSTMLNKPRRPLGCGLNPQYFDVPSDLVDPIHGTDVLGTRNKQFIFSDSQDDNQRGTHYSPSLVLSTCDTGSVISAVGPDDSVSNVGVPVSKSQSRFEPQPKHTIKIAKGHSIKRNSIFETRSSCSTDIKNKKPPSLCQKQDNSDTTSHVKPSTRFKKEQPSITPVKCCEAVTMREECSNNERQHSNGNERDLTNSKEKADYDSSDSDWSADESFVTAHCSSIRTPALTSPLQLAARLVRMKQNIR